MNAQKFNHTSSKILVTGTSGTGKTTLWEKLLHAEKARWKFVFDHQGEFSRRFGVPAVFDLDALCAGFERGGLIVFDPLKIAEEKDAEGKRRGMLKSFALFCDLVFAVSSQFRGRKILACDELQKLTSPKSETPELMTVLDTGRRFQLDFLAISQAPNRIHNGIRNQLTRLYTFRQSDANAVTYLADNGFDPEKIRSLPRGKYLWRNLDSGEAGEGGEAF